MKVIGRNLLLGPLAFAGAVAGHTLGYLVSHPGAHERSAALIGTGHGSFGRLTAVAAAAGGVAFVAVIIRACRRQALELRWLASRLVVLQLAIFALLELTERGFQPQETFGDPAVLVGLAAQVVVALGSALLARGAQGTVQAILGGPRTRRVRAPAVLRFIAPEEIPGRATLFGPERRRAPPLPLPA